LRKLADVHMCTHTHTHTRVCSHRQAGLVFGLMHSHYTYWI